jgi:hypothetical protein
MLVRRCAEGLCLTQFVSGLFGGGGAARQQAQQAQADAQSNRLLESIAQMRSQQIAQDQSSETGAQLAAGGASPRGRRLLLSTESGGLATTLGTSA